MFTTKISDTIYYTKSERNNRGDLIAIIEKCNDTYINRFGNKLYYEIRHIKTDTIKKFKTLKEAKLSLIN